MKAIAKTTDAITLLDPVTNHLISNDRPYLIQWTQFMTSRAGLGQIEILEKGLPDTADAAEFKEFLADSKTEEQAIAAFLSSLEPEAAPKTKKAASKKDAE